MTRQQYIAAYNNGSMHEGDHSYARLTMGQKQTGTPESIAAGRASPTAPGAGKGQGDGGNEWLRRIMEFYEQMNAPFDPNDPRYSGLLNGAYAQASHGMQNRGINGPMNTSYAQGAYLNLGNQMNHQRQGMALSALGQGLSGYQNQQSLEAQQAWQRYNADMAAYQQRQDGGAGMGAMIGGGIGGAIGSLGFLGGPVLGAATTGLGFQAGSALGAGAGGLTAGNAPVYRGTYNNVNNFRGY